MLWLLVWGCSDKSIEDQVEETPSIDPSQEGGWIVATKEDVFINRHGQELNIQFWYPTTEERSRLHEYDGIKEGGAQDGGAAACTETRPVVLFSHGNGGMRYQSYFLMEYLASHGFIVVAPDHLGNTAFDMNGVSRSELVFRRPEDIQDAFDFLLSESYFEGCVEEEKGYAIIGHSFGGYTSIALSGASLNTEETAVFCSNYPDAWLCDAVAQFSAENGPGIYDRSDDRIWAGVPMTPAGYEALFAGLGDITIPMFFWGGGKDDLTAMQWSVLPLYNEIQSEKMLAEIPLAGHYTFTNACDILPTYDDCGNGFIAPEDAHVLINTATTAFLAQQLGYKGWEEFVPLDSSDIVWH